MKKSTSVFKFGDLVIVEKAVNPAGLCSGIAVGSGIVVGFDPNDEESVLVNVGAAGNYHLVKCSPGELRLQDGGEELSRTKESGQRDREGAGYCGDCCWFKHEDTYGYGWCYEMQREMNCSDLCANGQYVAEERKRHYMAVLLQHNRWRRDDSVPNGCRAVNPKELGRAIDFAVKYMKKM